MKLFLDDERSLPNDSWHLARRAEEAIAILEQHGLTLTHISLDHDLGTKLNGYDVVCDLEELYYDGKINPNVKITIHSANPSGAKKMAMACAKMFGRNWTSFIVDYFNFCRHEDAQ